MDNHKNNACSTNGVGAVIIFFVLLFVFAKWGPAIPFSTITQSKGEPMIVTGEGKATAIPDNAKITVGIQESSQSLTQVQDSVNKKSQNLNSALKKLGINENDIKTTSYKIYPESDYNANPPRITSYRVSTSYEITIKKIDAVNDVLTTVTANGANVVGSLTFELSDEVKNKAMNEAREDAVKKAKESAQSLAKASNVTLGKIVNISESSQEYPRPLYLTQKATMLDEQVGTSTPEIQPGTTEINLVVSISYEIR